MESPEDRKLRRLISQDRTADYELDLTGLDELHAMASIERMIERQRFRGEAREVVIKLDPAGPDSGETLFQPVGRALLDYMKRGLVAVCRPLSPDVGAGFYVELPGRGEAAEDGSPDETGGEA